MIVNEYEVPPRGYVLLQATQPMVHVFISALEPVAVYLVDSRNLAHYQRGQEFVGHPFGQLQFYSKLLRLPSEAGPWHFVIENPSPDSRAHVQARIGSP